MTDSTLGCLLLIKNPKSFRPLGFYDGLCLCDVKSNSCNLLLHICCLILAHILQLLDGIFVSLVSCLLVPVDGLFAVFVGASTF